MPARWGWASSCRRAIGCGASDGDSDGQRDLISDKDDVFASIANYFVVHGWQRGGAVVARATRDAGAADFAPPTLDPIYPLATLARAAIGRRPANRAATGAPKARRCITLDGEAGKEYWLGYRNFYVITRYNHSPMYAMAVHQLAQAIRAGSGAHEGAGARRRYRRIGADRLQRRADEAIPTGATRVQALPVCPATAPAHQPACGVSPYAPAQEDLGKRGNYTRGGLYAPEIQDSAPTGLPMST